MRGQLAHASSDSKSSTNAMGNISAPKDCSAVSAGVRSSCLAFDTRNTPEDSSGLRHNGLSFSKLVGHVISFAASRRVGG